MHNNIRYEDKASSSLHDKGGNYVRDHHTKKHPPTSKGRSPSLANCMWSQGTKEATHQSTVFELWWLLHEKALLPRKSKPFGAYEVSIHCLKTEGSKALRSQDGQEDHLDHMEEPARWTLTSCPPVLSPWWQLGKVWGYLMWGTITDKYWKSLQNYNTWKQYRTGSVIVWQINEIKESLEFVPDTYSHFYIIKMAFPNSGSK